MNRKYKITILSVFIGGGLLFSQTIGNPVGTQGFKEWTLSASSNYSNIEIQNQKMVARKQIGKLSFGAASWLDVYVLGGASKLKIKFDPKNYEDDYRFTYGAGLRCEFLQDTPDRPMELWLDVQAFRFESENAYFNTTGTVTSPCKNYLSYDWREMNGSVGISYLWKRMKVYGGGVGWILQRIDKKREYWNAQWWGPYKETFQSGFWYGAAVGVEFRFPLEYRLCIEGMALNESNYQIMIGINQTKKYNR